MTILVLAEHNNIDIKSSTLNTISAASQIDQDIHVLVTGYECEELAKNISKCEKVSKVYLANNEKLKFRYFNEANLRWERYCNS